MIIMVVIRSNFVPVISMNWKEMKLLHGTKLTQCHQKKKKYDINLTNKRYLKIQFFGLKKVWPNDLQPLSTKWKEIGLPMDEDPEFNEFRVSSKLEKEKSFVASDELAMHYLNLVAKRLDPSFQQKMRDLFEENRKNLGMKYPTNNKDLAVLSGPVKTKARQRIKVKLDYFDQPTPQCMAVLDIVRCAIVCENDNELCNLYDMLIKEFSGKILRVKNAFDDILRKVPMVIVQY